MQFRLATGGTGGQQLGDGVGNLFRSLAMAPLYAAQGAEERQQAEAKAALMTTQQRQADAAAEQSRAHAALFGQQQQDLATQAQRGTLGEVIKNAALMNGVPTDLTPDLQHRITTGSLPSQYQTPVDGMGPVAPVPDALSTENVMRVMRAAGLTNQALTVGDKSVENIAKATGMYRDQGLGDAVLAGQRPAGLVGQAQAAMKGTKQIENIADTGEAFNIHTGERQRISNPLFTIFGDKANALIAKENAQAGASKASAASSYASAAKTRQDMELGAKGTPTMTDQGLLLVDPRGGTARAVIGPDGQPVGPKLKDIPPSVNTAIVSNMQNLAKAQAALDLVSGKNSGTATGDKNATGLKGYLPNGPLNYFDPKGVDARAAIADLGSMVLHERSGANVTASESPRLMPFIPLATDDPETIKKKLQRFIQIYRQETDFMGEQYSPSQGYKASPVLNRGGAPNTPDPLGLFSR